MKKDVSDKEFDLETRRIQKDFSLINQFDLAYLDNAATTQKPEQVLDAVKKYYEKENANPFRGVYKLSNDATIAYENARKKVADFIGAKTSSEIVFTRNATESINLVAYSLAANEFKAGDEIIVSIAEHHSNFLPWQMAAKSCGVRIIFWECDKDGVFAEEDLKKLITKNTKMLAVTHISNVFGRINDVKRFGEIAHEAGAKILVDGAQSVPHIPVDVQDLDCDYLVFSGHKMTAPMGIGVLYGKFDLLDEMTPFMYGGEMIESVTRNDVTFAEVPHKFEAGTVNVGGAVGLAAAIDYYESIGFETIVARERALTNYCFELIKGINNLEIIGGSSAGDHEGIITFRIDGVHPHDVASILDAGGVAVRAGHHCAQPLLKYLYDLKEEKPAGGISTTRASISFYNSKRDIETFAKALSKVRSEMGYDK